MMNLYNKTCRECSALITKRYSTSFSMGIRCFHEELREPICAIYGYVRFADEIVDTFHDFNKKELFERFKTDTYLALEEGISLNPVLHAFQEVVHQYKIDRAHIDAFLYSMELDLHQNTYNANGYEEYIYGSAEVVGLMCLRVFCEGDDLKYQSLVEPARKLGAAFQKVNFLRDLKSDFDDRGRVYFPGVDFTNFDESSKLIIEQDIEEDFENAYQGILALPEGARFGVYLAYIYYKKLFQKIKNSPAATVAKSRIRVNDTHKLWLLAGTAVKVRLRMI
jgi:phytoene synthase